MNRKITIVGSANVDFIMKAPKLPELGETVTDATFQQTFGGKGANQAVAAARAGGDVRFVTAVGFDDYGGQLLETWEGMGIDVTHAQRLRGSTTGAALVMIDAAGDNYLMVAPEANGKLVAEHVSEEVLADSGCVLLQNEIPPKTTVRTLDLCKSLGVPTSLNYAPFREGVIRVDDRVTNLVVNEVEAGALIGMNVGADNAEDAAYRLLSLGPKCVVITLGEIGSLAVDSEGTHRVGTFEVDAVDTTAAGDTYCGALAVALAEGKPMGEAMLFASAASALCVSKLGAQPSIPKREDIDRLVEKTG